jgi:hypothetical protein
MIKALGFLLLGVQERREDPQPTVLTVIAAGTRFRLAAVV